MRARARARPLRAYVSNWRRPAGFYSGALAASLVWQISLGLPLVCPAPPNPTLVHSLLSPSSPWDSVPAVPEYRKERTCLFYSLPSASWTHVSLSGTRIPLFSLLPMTMFLRIKESPYTTFMKSNWEREEDGEGTEIRDGQMAILAASIIPSSDI